MKFIIKRNNSDYIINCDENGNGGYNVVPKDIDPYNAYTIEEVETYLAEHPEDLLDMESIEAEEIRKNEIASLKAYLSSTDYIYPKCLELGLDVDIEYADVVSQRKSVRTRIQELGAPNE
jgi:hypothetical protein